MPIQLSYLDPETRQSRSQILEPPIAIGRDLSRISAQFNGDRLSPLLLSATDVSRFHAIITWDGDRLIVLDQNSAGGTQINQTQQQRGVLANGDRLQIGSYEITINFPIAPAPTSPPSIQLNWDDLATGTQQEVVLTLPVALGRQTSAMPDAIAGRSVSQILLDSSEISRYHALITLEHNRIYAIDQNSRNGLFINGQASPKSPLNTSDTLRLGPYEITVKIIETDRESPQTIARPGTVFGVGAVPSIAASPQPVIDFHPQSGLLAPQLPQPISPPIGTEFPPPAFRQPLVSPQNLHATGLPVGETDYLTVGAGLGSYIWADLLRISGVPINRIAAIGLEAQPYARYRQLCLNSQIPLHERLRSNSDSCPDNIWGWPGYALREAWHDLGRGRVSAALKELWQVFAEPTFSETYTPRLQNVCDSIDRETQRIGWPQIYRYGRVRAIRKTTDGRYVVAYSDREHQHGFWLARSLHLSPGYPAIKFLPDLQAYRERSRDFDAVLNAYEPHDPAYQYLQRQGGVVLLRGRGIVASRIVQRLYETRAINPNIQIIHLMRSPKPQGNKFQQAQRKVDNQYEFQPFNWPKACWGGELRDLLENSPPETRRQYLTDWGGTTTADRRDWSTIVEEGVTQGWYRIVFGEVDRVERNGSHTLTYIREMGLTQLVPLQADFIIDATGLDANANASPLLKDLVEMYQLPLNYLGRLSVANDFEVTAMRNQSGRLYTAGAITLGGPYAPVDSFLGLQYAALRSVESLSRDRAIQLRQLEGLRSLIQWVKWAVNRSP
jgi:pSer/pThr/pTyr-binding forkhead associated (FHA) protein